MKSGFRTLAYAAIITLSAVCGFAAVRFSDRAVALVTVIAAAAVSLILFVHAGRRRSPMYLSLVAVMTALSVVGRIVFAPFSGFKPCTAVIIIAGITLGADAGFICGALTAVVSNIYFGQGIWTVFQLFSWGIVGLISGIAAKYLGRSKIILYIYGAVSGILYSAILDFFSVVWQDGGFNPIRFAAYAAGSLPYAAVYAVSNVVFLALMYRRTSFAIGRVVKKYGL
jgi:energy-coupling factor transport system substrate-specific component